MLLALAACGPAGSPEELLARAESALAKGDANTALVDVKAALQQAPDSASGRALLSRVHTVQQNHTLALEAIERAVELGKPPARNHLLELAQQLSELNQWDRLLDLENLGRFLSVEDDPSVIVNVALARAVTGDTRTARAALAALGDATALSPDARFSLARFEFLVNDDPSQAAELLAGLVDENPDNAKAWSMLGDMRQRLGDAAAARTGYARAAALNPYRISDRLNVLSLDISAGEVSDADIRLKEIGQAAPDHPGLDLARGLLELQEERYADAVDSFARVLKVVPRHATSIYLSGVANAASGNLATARNQLAEFLTLRPDNYAGNLQLAGVYLRDNNAETAEEVLRNMLNRHGWRAPTISLLAFALGAQGQHAESARLYEELIASDRNASVHLRQRAAQAALNAGNGERAVDLLEGITESDEEPQLGTYAQLVRTYLALENTEAADATVERARELFPTDPGTELMLAQAAMLSGDAGAFREHMESAAELDPTNLSVTWTLAMVELQQGDPQSAASRLAGSLEESPTDLGLLMALAAAQEQNRELTEMRATLQSAIEQHPDALEPRIALARDRVRQGQAREALTLLQPVRESAEAQRDPLLQELLATAYLALDEPAQAVAPARLLVELTPRSLSALRLLAGAQRQAGDTPGARETLSRAYELFPSTPTVAMAYAEVLAQAGQMSEAAGVIDAMPEETLNTPTVRIARGRVAMAMGDTALAEERFSQVHSAYPETATVLLLAGSIWAQDARRAEAVDLLGDWVKNHADDTAVRAAYASLLSQTDREPEAIEQYAVLVESMPDNLLYLNNYAWLLRGSDGERALEVAQRAKSLAPDNGEVLDTLAMVHLSRGEIELALRESERALELAPDSADVVRHRDEIRRAAGLSDEAGR